MGFATDLGYIPPNVKEQLRSLDLLLLESNHDLETLRDGPYPWAVKQRVLSRVGHLSNDATAEFLSNAYDGQAAYIILGHLSENNNLPELAKVAAERALVGRASLLANRLLLAEQHQPLSAIAFSLKALEYKHRPTNSQSIGAGPNSLTRAGEEPSEVCKSGTFSILSPCRGVQWVTSECKCRELNFIFCKAGLYVCSENPMHRPGCGLHFGKLAI